MGVYDQIKTAFQDIIAPELHAIRSDIQRLDQKIDGVDARLNQRLESMDGRLTTKIDGLKAELLSEIRRLDGEIDSQKAETLSMKAELLSEIRRLDARIDAIDRHLQTAIDLRERIVALEAKIRP